MRTVCFDGKGLLFIEMLTPGYKKVLTSHGWTRLYTPFGEDQFVYSGKIKFE